MAFTPQALDDLNDYARTLLEASRPDAAANPAAAVERWTPYHDLLHGVAPHPRPFVSVSLDEVLPLAPFALTPEALFPCAPAEARRRAAAADARNGLVEEGLTTLAAIVPGWAACAESEARHAFEPLYATMRRVGTNLPGMLDVARLSVFQQFALVAALYAASGCQPTPSESFLLVEGDTPGIQRFVGGSVTSEGVAKGLRGRSLLQLLADAVTRRLLDALDLPRANLLYTGGGHFLLLAPGGNEARATLEQVRRDISQDLFRETGRELDQALAWTPVSRQNLTNDDGLRAAMQTLHGELASEKRRPYATLFASGDQTVYGAIFDPLTGGDQEEVGRAQDEAEEPYKTLANTLARVPEGETLYLHRCYGADPDRRHQWTWQAILHAVSGRWRYDLSAAPRDSDAPCTHLVDAINDPTAVPKRATGFRFLAVTTPRASSGASDDAPDDPAARDIRDLSGIAGVTPMGRIGVLRMDVDNLGAAFRDLSPYSLATICTLSAALETFFAGWLNTVCANVQTGSDLIPRDPSVPPKRGDLLYTLYSGGDDLFIVGAWDRLPVLAHAIRADFRRCFPTRTVSAGIAVEGAHFPIYRLADRAADALDAAKARQEGRGNRVKDALTFLDHTLPWDDYHTVAGLVAQLTDRALKDEPAAVLGRLMDIALLDRAERRQFAPLLAAIGRALPPTGVVGRAKWRGLVALQRAIEREEDPHSPLAQALNDLKKNLLADDLTPHLTLAARWADYLWRPTNEREA